MTIARPHRRRVGSAGARSLSLHREFSVPLLGGRVKPAALAVFTRQLATLVEAGMPLLRGLRLLQEQEGNATLKRIMGELAESIEGGSSLSEALAAHPKVFNRLYTNMTKAGEMAGALEVTFRRLAEFMEKARKIKGKVKAALFYPTTVLIVSVIILWAMMVFVIPRFQQVFDGLLDGASMPGFTLFVLALSAGVKNHLLTTGFLGVGSIVIAMFLPLIEAVNRGFDPTFDRADP